MRNNVALWLICLLTVILCVLTLSACGKAPEPSRPDAPTEPVANLKKAEEHLVYISLGSQYDPEVSTMMITTPEDRDYTGGTVLTYQKSIGGYTTLLEEGTYQIFLNTYVNDRRVGDCRYLVVDADHSYYHVWFSENGRIEG